jgi:RNA 3'-terminal phosphate cyclase
MISGKAPRFAHYPPGGGHLTPRIIRVSPSVSQFKVGLIARRLLNAVTSLQDGQLIQGSISSGDQGTATTSRAERLSPKIAKRQKQAA